MSTAVLLNIEDGVATITLNRPDRLNAFEEDMANGWAEATRAATQDPQVRSIIIAAAGRAFCAGGDVREMATLADKNEGIRTLAQRINEGILALVESNIPVVAAAHGTTAGGGLGILLASDYAVIGESSRIGSLYAGVGLTPDLSVSAHLSRAIGERRALQLTLQDNLLTAQQAVAWGLAAEAVEDENVFARARDIAKQWAANAHAYGEAKRLIRSERGRTFKEQLEEEARTIGVAAVTAEGQARIQAFAQR